MKCLMCGTTKDVRTIKLPHGNVHVCHRNICLQKLTVTINEGNAPVVWVGTEDLTLRDDLNITEAELDTMAAEDMIEIADTMADSLWNGYFGDDFSSLIEEAVKHWRVWKEAETIRRAPDKDLLLYINPKYPQNKYILEKRLTKGL